MRAIRWTILLIAVVLAALSPSSASAKTRNDKLRPTGQATVHLKWRVAWHLVSEGLFASSAVVDPGGRYVLITPRGPWGAGGSAVVVDEQTGEQTIVPPEEVPPQPCYPVGIGFPWVSADCYDARAALYSIPNQSWQLLPTPSGACVGAGIPPNCGDSPSLVGRFWVEWVRSVHTGPCCTNLSRYYQSISTGQVRSDPTNAKTIPDLDSPSLARSVCAPLSVPGSAGDFGTLTFDGRFVIASGPANQLVTMLPQPPNHSYIERCGTKLHKPIGDGAIANAHAVVWVASNRQLAGLFLPSLGHFVIPLPPALSKAPPGYVLTGPVLFALSSRTLYATQVLGGATGASDTVRLWTAPTPAATGGKHSST
jgi:hypothetical protein